MECGLEYRRRTPIFEAAHYGRIEVLKLLINRGANIQHLDARTRLLCSLQRVA